MSIEAANGQRRDGLTVSTVWAELLNVPPDRATDVGCIRVTATDAVVELRLRSTVNRATEVMTYVAGAGESVDIPVPPWGAQLDYRVPHVTTDGHDSAGYRESPTGQPSVSAVYRPGHPPEDPQPRIPAAHVQDIPGNAGGWASGTVLDVAIPLGPPGVYRLLWARVARTLNGGTPNATTFTAFALAWDGDYSLGNVGEYNTTAAAVGTGIALPNGALTVYGASHPRSGLTTDGRCTLRVIVDAQPDAAERYQLRAAFERLAEWRPVGNRVSFS